MSRHVTSLGQSLEPPVYNTEERIVPCDCGNRVPEDETIPCEHCKSIGCRRCMSLKDGDWFCGRPIQTSECYKQFMEKHNG
jgi:hypothetical protein